MPSFSKFVHVHGSALTIAFYLMVAAAGIYFGTSSTQRSSTPEVVEADDTTENVVN